MVYLQRQFILSFFSVVSRLCSGLKNAHHKDISPMKHGEHRGEPLNIFLVGSSDNKKVFLYVLCVLCGELNLSTH